MHLFLHDNPVRTVTDCKRHAHIHTGHWQFPGGHLEFGETPLQCAERETLEETSLVVRAKRVVAVTNDVFAESGKHYITLFVVCDRVDETQEPEVYHNHLT